MTPLEKAIRAGCGSYTEISCKYPDCGCQWMPEMVRKGIAAALTDDEATFEALRKPINSGHPSAVLAALRRHILGGGETS